MPLQHSETPNAWMKVSLLCITCADYLLQPSILLIQWDWRHCLLPAACVHFLLQLELHQHRSIGWLGELGQWQNLSSWWAWEWGWVKEIFVPALFEDKLHVYTCAPGLLQYLFPLWNENNTVSINEKLLIWPTQNTGTVDTYRAWLFSHGMFVNN